MSKSWVKITGVVALSLAVTAMVYVFWPVETQPQKENEVNLEPQPKAQKLEESQTVEPAKPKQPETAQQESPGPTAEKLYQMALLHTPGNSPKPSYQIMVDSCRKIFTQYPNTAQAEKARELLRQYDMTDQQISRLYSSGPAVKKSRPLRRRPPRRDDEWFIATNNEVNRSN